MTQLCVHEYNISEENIWRNFGRFFLYSKETIKEGEILVSDITSTSAFLQWRDYGSFFYSVFYESSDVMDSVPGIFNPEVELFLSRPGTVFNITVRDSSNMDVASTRIRTGRQ